MSNDVTGVAVPARAATASRLSPCGSSAKLASTNADEWPCWEVGLYGFGDIYVEAPTKASARWYAASKCHEAGYGRSPIELIERGVDIREVNRTFAAMMGDVHRVKRLVRKEDRA